MKKSKFTEQQIAFTLKQADRRPDQPALSKRIREMAETRVRGSALVRPMAGASAVCPG
jgi:hypothetical protein